MTAVAIQFSTSGTPPVFDFSAPVVGFTTTVQNTLVCVGTRIGTDQIFTDRGTSLLEDANQGGLTDINTAQQAASFAGNDVLIFTQLADDPNNIYRLTSFNLTAVSLTNQMLDLTVSAGDANGDSIGINVIM
jgi:hypothetical protein